MFSSFSLTNTERVILLVKVQMHNNSKDLIPFFSLAEATAVTDCNITKMISTVCNELTLSMPLIWLLQRLVSGL